MPHPRFRTSLMLALLALACAAYSVVGARPAAPPYPIAPNTGTWHDTSGMVSEHESHTATPLANGDVLVIAGRYGGADHADLYNPTNGTWRATGRLLTARFDHTATYLEDGRVLVAGGQQSNRFFTAELYTPSTGTWSATGNMTVARAGHTATRLPNGKVLVAGGGEASAELYDPTTGTWSSTGSMTISRLYHTAILLPFNHKVLVVGGSNSANTELYDPDSGTWSLTGSITTLRPYGHTATLLSDGRVLVTGGKNGGALADAEVYDPMTGMWNVTGSMTTARYNHTATLLTDNQVLITGGDTVSQSGNGVTATSELYNPLSGTWSPTGSMSTPRHFHTATRLLNGQVLAAGGLGPNGIGINSAELYDPSIPLPPSPTPCIATTSLNADFESGTLAPFTASSIPTTTLWVNSTANAHTGTHAAYALDVAFVADQRLTLAAPIAIPTGLAAATLSFWQKHTFDTTYDGGVLEYSTDSGHSWIDAGALITTNGYNGTIATGFNNPLSGRLAWVETSGWAQVAVDLTTLSGQNILFRFRLGSDNTSAAAGWYVDDVRITLTQSPCGPVSTSTPTAPPTHTATALPPPTTPIPTSTPVASATPDLTATPTSTPTAFPNTVYLGTFFYNACAENPDAYEPNDTPALAWPQATPLPDQLAIPTANLACTDADDYFRFTVTTAATYRIHLTKSANVNTGIFLYTALAPSGYQYGLWDPDHQATTLEFTWPLQPGTYYLQLHAFDHAGDPTYALLAAPESMR